MRCDRVKERLPQYIEGSITGKDVLSIEDHLKGCPDCRHELDILRELDARLKQEAPKIWESIEPSPEFLARLKRMELQKPPSHISGMIEGLSTLWERHRIALATGLSVFLVIALAFTGVFSSGSDDDDEETTIAIATATPTMEKSVADQPGPLGPAGPQGPRGPERAAGSKESALPSPEETTSTLPVPMVVPTPTSEPAQTPLRAMPPEPAEADNALDITVTGTGHTADQEELAKEIALADPKVKQFIETFWDQEIQYSIAGEHDFACDGPVVVIAKKAVDPQGTSIYVCVDLAKGEVVKVEEFPITPEN